MTLGADVKVGSTGCQGVLSGFEIGRNGLAMRTALAPTSIPEPATTTMLLGGLLLLGCMHRSHLKKSASRRVCSATIASDLDNGTGNAIATLSEGSCSPSATTFR